MDIIDKIIDSIHGMEQDGLPTMDLIDEVEILEYKKHNSGGISDVYQKPWGKLNHGQRINRLNLFCNKKIVDNKLSTKEAAEFKSTIMEGCIATPDIVEYDSVTGNITKIRGLSNLELTIDPVSTSSTSISFTMIPLSLEKLSISQKKKPIIKRRT